jgi:hypothetical protein
MRLSASASIRQALYEDRWTICLPLDSHRCDALCGAWYTNSVPKGLLDDTEIEQDTHTRLGASCAKIFFILCDKGEKNEGANVDEARQRSDPAENVVVLLDALIDLPCRLRRIRALFSCASRNVFFRAFREVVCVGCHEPWT